MQHHLTWRPARAVWTDHVFVVTFRSDKWREELKMNSEVPIEQLLDVEYLGKGRLMVSEAGSQCRACVGRFTATQWQKQKVTSVMSREAVVTRQSVP